MNITKETVTPKKAMEWLKRNVHNRPLSPKTVDRYAAAMTRDVWKLNGDCIRFNGNGDMIDGQHRLTACVQAGKPFESYVVRGLPHEAFDTIDQGRKRTTGDIFARSGYEHYTTLAAAVRNYWRYLNGFAATHGAIPPDVANDILEKNPSIHSAVAFVCKMQSNRSTRSLMHGGVASFLVFLTGEIDQEGSQKFWTSVFTGEGLTRTMAAYWLRERLIANSGNTARLHADTIAALAIKAWNSFRSGKPCKALKWDSREDFPKAE